jgi:hypothetical protein
MNRYDVIAIDLAPLNAGGDTLLRESLRRALSSAASISLAVIVDERQAFSKLPPCSTLRKGAIRCRRRHERDVARSSFRPSTHTPRRACGACVATGRSWKVAARILEIAAALVTTPIEQALDQRNAAEELSRMVAVRGHQHVLGTHRARRADTDRFLAERGGERPSWPGVED